jgi:DeoR/GlpR family transcriptional regulator of sugar metabolism
MLSAERQRVISELVSRRGVADVADLAETLGVSASTVRRDLEKLERRGLIRRIHGGAAAPDGSHYAASATGPAPSRDTWDAERIGRAAAKRIQPHETIYLGPGRLTLAAAQALAANSGITIVTNSLEIAYWLATRSDLSVILTGGRVGRPRDRLDGPLVKHALRTLRADRVIIEAVGISPDQGLMDVDLEQAELCRGLIEAPGETVVLVPPERIGRVGGVLIGPASDADVIITGRQASEATLWDLSQLGIDIISV